MGEKLATVHSVHSVHSIHPNIAVNQRGEAEAEPERAPEAPKQMSRRRRTALLWGRVRGAHFREVPLSRAGSRQIYELLASCSHVEDEATMRRACGLVLRTAAARNELAYEDAGKEPYIAPIVITDGVRKALADIMNISVRPRGFSLRAIAGYPYLLEVFAPPSTLSAEDIFQYGIGRHQDVPLAVLVEALRGAYHYEKYARKAYTEDGKPRYSREAIRAMLDASLDGYRGNGMLQRFGNRFNADGRPILDRWYNQNGT